MKLWSVIWLLLFSTWNFYFSRTTFSVKRLAKYASALSGGFLIGKILCDMYRNINPKLRRKVRIPTKNLNQQIWSTVTFSRLLVFRTLKVYFFIIIWGGFYLILVVTGYWSYMKEYFYWYFYWKTILQINIAAVYLETCKRSFVEILCKNRCGF